MKVKLDFVSSLFFFLLAIYVSIESYRFGLGKWDMPGAGFFSFGAGLLLGFMSLTVLIKSIRTWSSQKLSVVPSERLHWKKAVYVLGSMIIYVVVLERIGGFFTRLTDVGQ